jgi:hypothetical protein
MSRFPVGGRRVSRQNWIPLQITTGCFSHLFERHGFSSFAVAKAVKAKQTCDLRRASRSCCRFGQKLQNRNPGAVSVGVGWSGVR